MSVFKRYRTKVLIEAKPMDHEGTCYQPRTGEKEPFRAGDYLVREPGGKQHIEPREKFLREFESIDE